MSKNMTRKGFALGSALALLLTGFVSAPAKAATTVTTAVDKDTIAATLVGASNAIDLSTTMSADLITSNLEESLKYRILNPSAAGLIISVGNDGSAGTVSASDGTNDFVNSVTGAAITNTATAAGTPITNTDFVVIPANFAANEKGDAAASNILRIATTATVTTTITVQAFIDSSSPAASLMDTIEDKGNSFEVTFYAASALTWTTSLDKPAATDTSLSASVTTSPKVNGNYITAPTVKFTRQDSTATLESASATWSNVTDSWSTTMSLTDTKNWVGMPNWIGVATSGGTHANDTVTVTADANHNLSTGDVVSFITTKNDTSNPVVNLSAASKAITKTSATAFTVVSTADFGADVAAGADTSAYIVVKKIKLASVEATKTVATYTTGSPHRLRVGDFVTIDASNNGIFDRTTRVAVASVPTTTTFTVALATAQDAVTASAADTGLVTYDSFERAFVGTYTAQAYWNSALQGVASDSGTINVAAASMKVTTTASASVQGVDAAGAAGTIYVKAGTLSVPVTLTVLDADDEPVGAGHPVTVGTLTPTGAVTVNARSTSGEVLYTDANGQVSLTVASSTGTAGHSVVFEATPENVTAANAGFTMTWAAASVGLVDLNTTAGQLTAGSTFNRKVLEDGSYDLNLMVSDQWFTPADSATYRLLVSGDGATGGAYALTGGKAVVKISDLDIGSTWNTVVKLQKASGSSWVDSATYTFANDDITTAAVKLGADGSNAYGNTADLSDKVAAVALVEIDKRLQSTATPAYLNDVVVNGQVTNKASGAALEGAHVTISGPTNILFSNGQVAARGTITVLSDANGKFEVNMYSTTAQTDTVITVASLGASSTTKVSFTGTGVGEGTNLTVTTPAAVKPASTFKVSASLKDAYGNPVDTAASRIKVTHTGPGIVYGTLPTETDAFGELSFSVLLGSNDSGNITFQVQYDQNGDGDFKDAKDLSVTNTVEINATGTASGDSKVNAGSFKGYVAIYAKGYEGKRLSAKVGKDWVVVPALASNFVRVVEYTGAGYTISVPIYIDRVLVDTITVTTK